MTTFDALIHELRARAREITATELADAGAVTVIDVREADEYARGAIAGAVWIARGLLESNIERAAPDRATPLVVYCASGNRSVLAARTLQELGYSDVRSLAGGFAAYLRSGLPWHTPTALGPAQAERYARHLSLPEVGVAGQHKLLAARVVSVGAGGLGCPAALYLAAAGVGTLGLIDHDVVDASNLMRQILHASDRVGVAKVDSARQALAQINPEVIVHAHRTRLTSANALELLAPYDIIIDGSDNFPTRYLVNDAALRLAKPVVHASIYRFEGQITQFSAHGRPCYRCLYPRPPLPDAGASCAEAGVLGVLPGVVGVLQATEAIKIILGLGEQLAGRLILYDALTARFRELAIARDPACPSCGDGVDRATLELGGYDEFCAARS